MKFRIEKKTVGEKVTYQPQVLVEHPVEPSIAMWDNLIKCDNEIRVHATIGFNPNSIVLNSPYQRWASLVQAKSIIDEFANKETDKEKIKDVTEYIDYEPK